MRAIDREGQFKEAVMERSEFVTPMAIEFPGRAGILEIPKKLMAIRLRWLVVITCSFLLLYSQDQTLAPSTAYSFILLYIFSNAILYWVNERLFESSYFYAPLVLLDTFCATAALMVSGQVTTDFYLVYFLLIILCALFEDFLGLIVVAGLSILVYGYLLFNTAEVLPPGSYLRLPFLFVVALFYGYFAHIVHGEKALKVQAQIRQIIAEHLAEAERLKSEFLRNTTHELRTPLTTIMGYSDLLIEEAFGPITEAQKGAVARLMESARGLLGIVEQILDLSKIAKGEMVSATRRQDVKALINQLRREIAPLESGKPYKVQYEIGPGIPAVETDGEKLKRVLSNILSNALKFTDRGEVKLSVIKERTGELSFAIADTGIGIPKEKIPLIFESFRQLDGSQTRRHGGTGLGMAISKNLVDLIGGRIEVESEVGRGSIFRVSIPLGAHS